MPIWLLVILGIIVLLAILVLVKSVRIVPQAYAGIVERFGKYRTTLSAGLNIVTPFVDRVRYIIDLREQVVSFPPQPVITEDNLVVSIDTVIYFQVTNPVSATYEIANYIQAIEQLTMTTLRNITGGMDLEQALTSRDEINNALRGVLDEATGRWGIRVNRVELKGIDPPPSIKDSMEKQMRADRDKRAAILTAEGMRQSQILTAEGQKQSAILTAEGDREAVILRAQGDRESRILRAQGEGRRSSPSSSRSTTARPTRRCWPTSTCRCCRRSPRATPTRSGSSRARSARRSRVWAARSARSRASRTTSRGRVPASTTATRSTPTSPRRNRATRRSSKANEEVDAGDRLGGGGGPAGAARHMQHGTPAGPDEPGAATVARARHRLPRPDLMPDPRTAAARAASPVTLLEALAVFVAGIGAGTINTIVGSGTLITFPTLLAVGFPPVSANVSNTVGLVPGSVSGALGYRRELTGQRSQADPARHGVGARRHHRCAAAAEASAQRHSRPSCRC